MSDPFISLRSVSKSYDGKVRVVEQLDLDIARHEFLTLLGPSGSGKTTILTMLAGFEAPSTGDILMDGRSITRLPPHSRNIGVVFQNYALFPHMTVAQNVIFPLAVRRLARDEREARARQALDMVGLGQHLDRRPSQLSGGQQQRVALARALVFHPDLILMDEPLGALDNTLRKRMQFEIKALQRKLGVAVVFVTHDQGEALVMSDRIAVFDKGRIQQIGRPEEVYARPANAFVAGFIGETSWLEGRVASRAGAIVEIDSPAGRIRARPADAELAEGTTVRVAIRPEDISLSSAPGAGIAARIEGRSYLGDHVLLALRTRDGTPVVAKVPKSSNPAIAPDDASEPQLVWEDSAAIVFATDA